MEKKQSPVAKRIVSASLLAGSLLGLTAQSHAAIDLNYSSLGSGAEVRSNLLKSTMDEAKNWELKCGGDSGKASKESKSKDHISSAPV